MPDAVGQPLCGNPLGQLRPNWTDGVDRAPDVSRESITGPQPADRHIETSDQKVGISSTSERAGTSFIVLVAGPSPVFWPRRGSSARALTPP